MPVLSLVAAGIIGGTAAGLGEVFFEKHLGAKVEKYVPHIVIAGLLFLAFTRERV